MTGRIQKLQNNEWKFMHGDFPEAKEAGFDDSAWYDIGLPHSFGIPYFMENEFYVGYGCYRKTLKIEEAWIGKCISLEFQGAFQETEVYCNDMLAGTHKGGYTAFLVDLTPYVRAGDNQIFVRVNNLWNPRLAPRGGEHVFNGGIYRDVSLLVTEPLHIAWYGTWVTTPAVSEKEAEVAVRTEVVNESKETICGRLVSELFYEGNACGRMETEICLAPGEGKEYEQQTVLENPNLWHPDTPNLYTLHSVLQQAESVTDSCETTFGIRWFTFTADKGFFLNGAHYDIHGANVHQDHAGWSDAVTHSGIRRDIAMVKECGMNFIRGSHYPHHTYFAEECDRQGILFWSENCFWGTGGPTLDGYWTASAYPVREEEEEAFEESCFGTLREMIRTNRNHPSIIVWSMCNEPFFSSGEVMHKAKALVKKLVELSHKLDPTRPAAVGGAQRGGFDSLGDIAGYNGDGASIFMDPGFPNFVSEYGSTVADRPGEYNHRYRDGVEVDYPWRSGKSLWCAFHHGSILYDMGHMGIIDYYRLPLDDWYWYRETLTGVKRPEPAAEGAPARLKLTADRTQMAGDGTEDVQLTVSVEDENGRRTKKAPAVTLTVVSGGGRFPTGKSFVLSKEKGSLLEGLGAIELHAWYAGDTVVRATAEGLPEAEVTISVVGDFPWENRQLVELLPPPYVTGAPDRGEEFEIGGDRPVFSSSADAEHPARNVTDASYETYWYPAAKTDGEWILVDLEGCKDIRRMGIFFPEVVNEVFEVSLTDDRENFQTVYTASEGDANTFLELVLQEEKARYVRILFPGKPAKVGRVMLWA